VIKGLAEDQLADNENEPVELAAVPRFLNSPILPSYVLYNIINSNAVKEWYYMDIKPNTSDIRDFVGELDQSSATWREGQGCLGRSLRTLAEAI
jgi:hypothetical protein